LNGTIRFVHSAIVSRGGPDIAQGFNFSGDVTSAVIVNSQILRQADGSRTKGLSLDTAISALQFGDYVTNLRVMGNNFAGWPVFVSGRLDMPSSQMISAWRRRRSLSTIDQLNAMRSGIDNNVSVSIPNEYATLDYQELSAISDRRRLGQTLVETIYPRLRLPIGNATVDAGVPPDRFTGSLAAEMSSYFSKDFGGVGRFENPDIGPFESR
jgi:hypothetical protein